MPSQLSHFLSQAPLQEGGYPQPTPEEALRIPARSRGGLLADSSSQADAALTAATPLSPGAGYNRRAREAAYSSFLGAGLHFHAPIDDAAATSTYKPSDAAEGQTSPFHAKQALAPGTGYWCSAGHLSEDSNIDVQTLRCGR